MERWEDTQHNAMHKFFVQFFENVCLYETESSGKTQMPIKL